MKPTHEQQQVDRLLQAFHSAEVRPDFERAVLMNVSRTLRNASPSPARGSVGRTSVFALCSAAALTVGVLLSGHRLVLHQARQAGVQSSTVGIPPQTGELAKTRVLRASVTPPMRRLVPVKRVLDTRPAVRKALAREAVVAPTYPAPPAPLSEQERLLLGVAQKGAPEQREFLDPEVQVAREQKKQEEFSRFLHGGVR